MSPAKGRRAPGRLTPKGEQTRQRIVAAAAELMFDGGVSGTSIEDVRAAAGVSSSQVYHYFKDKKALVEAVIEYQTETIVGGQEPMLAALDSMEGLRAWRDFLVKHQEEPGCQGLPLSGCSQLCRAGCCSPRCSAAPKPLEAALDAMLALIVHEAAA